MQCDQERSRSGDDRSSVRQNKRRHVEDLKKTINTVWSYTLIEQIPQCCHAVRIKSGHSILDFPCHSAPRSGVRLLRQSPQGTVKPSGVVGGDRRGENMVDYLGRRGADVVDWPSS
jgi:hypothetical protein